MAVDETQLIDDYGPRILYIALRRLRDRTLAEEVWGEISHTINYPEETGSEACKEQLKVLARLVSGCSRLVDSIVVSYDEYNEKIGRT